MASLRATGMRGYILANLKVGDEKDFFSALSSLQEVLHVYYLFDEYEYLLELEGRSVEDLAHVMRERIRRLPGVERTAMFVEGNTGMFSPVERSQGQESPQTLF